MKLLLFSCALVILTVIAVSNRWIVEAGWEAGCWTGVAATHDPYLNSREFRNVVFTTKCQPTF